MSLFKEGYQMHRNEGYGKLRSFWETIKAVWL